MNHDFDKGRKYAPLKIWLIAFFVFIVLVSSLYAFCLFFLDAGGRTYEKHNLNTLIDFKESIKEFPNEKHVVVVGSSVIQYALWCPSQFFEVQEKDSRINVYKIIEGGYQLEYFVNELHLFDTLERYKPDLVLIEDNLVFMKTPNQYGENQITKTYLEFLNTLRNGKNILIGWEGSNCTSPDYSNKLDSLEIKLSFQEINHNLDDSLSNSVLVSDLRIGLLESPRAAIYNKAFRHSDIYKEIEKRREYYLGKYGFDYISFDQVFPWSYFLDEGHMNEKGQKRYSLWLIGTLEGYFTN